MSIHLKLTYVALPSLRSTLQIVHSKDAHTIFLLVGFKLIFTDCCEDSTLAYCFMFTLTVANCRLFPLVPTFKTKQNKKQKSSTILLILQSYTKSKKMTKMVKYTHIFQDKSPFFVF
jgi:hypothetical protein